jgi:hypothetical protein
VKDREVQFTVNSNNVPGERRMTEIFPLRNYVFFNEGSTEIPNRYVSLTKNQVKDFKEDQLKHLLQKNLSDRSKRQMTVLQRTEYPWRPNAKKSFSNNYFGRFIK